METSKPEGKRSINETEMAEGGEDEDEDVEEDNKKKRALTLSGRKLTGGGSTTTQLFCQVENCGSDMTDAKPYHRRHKVCEIHAKAPSVLINGAQQRFCQQCSRFHELAQFDEAKRSCRRRLAGHNERRRRITYDSQGEGSS